MATTFAKGEVWASVDKIMPHVERILLYGPPGTGKTHIANLGSLRESEKVFQLTLTPDTPAAAIIGHFIIKNRGCVWMDGTGIAAWKHSLKHPTRLVINEVDHAGPDAISALHLILDDVKTAGITLPTGENVKPGDNLRIVGTMNGIPTDLLPSLQDRFPVRVPIEEVHPDAVKILPEHLRNIAVNSSTITEKTRRISIRAWHAYAKLSETTGDAELSAKCIFGDRWKELVDALKISKDK